MENTTRCPPFDSPSATPCESGSAPHLLTSNHTVIILLTVFVASLAVVSVFANGIIIVAICRTYLFRTPSDRKSSIDDITCGREISSRKSIPSGKYIHSGKDMPSGSYIINDMFIPSGNDNSASSLSDQSLSHQSQTEEQSSKAKGPDSIPVHRIDTVTTVAQVINTYTTPENSNLSYERCPHWSHDDICNRREEGSLMATEPRPMSAEFDSRITISLPPESCAGSKNTSGPNDKSSPGSKIRTDLIPESSIESRTSTGINPNSSFGSMITTDSTVKCSTGSKITSPNDAGLSVFCIEDTFRSETTEANSAPREPDALEHACFDVTLMGNPYVRVTSTSDTTATSDKFSTITQISAEESSMHSSTDLKHSSALEATQKMQSLTPSTDASKVKHFTTMKLVATDSPTVGQQKNVSNAPVSNRPRRRLNSDTNSIPILLILSMSVSDAMLCAVILPLLALEIFYNGTWRLGADICALRMSLDFILTATSVSHVACLAFDRYLSICRPFYHRRLTMRAGLLAVTVCWTLSIVECALIHVSGLWSVGLYDIPSTCGPAHDKRSGTPVNNSDDRGTSVNNSDDFSAPVNNTGGSRYYLCVQGADNGHPIVSATFLTPLFVTFVLYAAIVIELRKIFKKHSSLLRLNGQTNSSSYTIGNEATGGISRTRSKNALPIFKSRRQQLTICFGRCGTFSRKERQNAELKHFQNSLSHNANKDDNLVDKNIRDSPETCRNRLNLKTEGRPELSYSTLKKPSIRHLKAVKTIGGVVFCFAACWLPFCIFILVAKGLKAYHYSHLVVFFLAYFNSCLNPLLYYSHAPIKSAVIDLFGSKRR